MKKVLFASVLKPVNDPRMYSKLGLSLAETGKYEVHIAGFKAEAAAKKVIFHPLFKFQRLSFQRVLAPWRIFLLALKLHPDMFIVCTHELLFVAVVYKFLTGVPVIYDVQENYIRNILFMNTFPVIIRHVLAFYITVKERMLAPLINGFVLAERIYEKQLKFIHDFLILENKVQTFEKRLPVPLPLTFQSSGFIKFIYTGTISEDYGILDAIDFFERLHRNWQNFEFEVKGVCTKHSFREHLLLRIACCPFIRADIRSVPIPHEEILQALRTSDMAVLPYRMSPAFEGKIPAKMYECLFFGKPMLIRKTDEWSNLLEPFQAALFTDFFETNNFLNRLFSIEFYKKIPEAAQILWQYDQKKWIDYVSQMID